MRKPGYSEEDGLVVLRMTREDSEHILGALGWAAVRGKAPADLQNGPHNL